MENLMESVRNLKDLLVDVSTDLTFYNQIFGAVEKVEILKEFSEWVFSNYQRCLADTIFTKLSKLLDPEKTFGFNNLSFKYVIDDASLTCDKDIKAAKEKLEVIFVKSGLKKYRNKVLAHNDALSIQNSINHSIHFENGIEHFLASMWELFALIEFKSGNETVLPSYGVGVIIPADLDGETFLLKLKKCI